MGTIYLGSIHQHDQTIACVATYSFPAPWHDMIVSSSVSDQNQWGGKQSRVSGAADTSCGCGFDY